MQKWSSFFFPFKAVLHLERKLIIGNSIINGETEKCSVTDLIRNLHKEIYFFVCFVIGALMYNTLPTWCNSSECHKEEN